MRFVALVFVFLLGGVVTAYTPVGDYIPPKDQLLTSVRNAAPFLADWLPGLAVEKPFDVSEPSLAPDTTTTQLADSPEDVQKNQTDPTPFWTRLGTDDIEGVLASLELPSERLLLETGEPYIAVVRPDAFSFYLRPRRCDQLQDCAGLQIFSTFAVDMPREQLAELNEAYASVKFYMDMDGFLVLETHLSTDFGVSPDNVRASIEMFVMVLDTFSDELRTDGLEKDIPELDSAS